MKWVAAYVFAFILSTVAHGQNRKRAAATTNEYELTAEVNRLVNAKRSIFLLPRLKLNDTISSIAAWHSRNMAAGKYGLGHDEFGKRADSLSKLLPDSQGMGENVTFAADAEEAVTLWWTSEGHQANITGDYNQSGIGIAKGEAGFWFFTQIFVRR